MASFAYKLNAATYRENTLRSAINAHIKVLSRHCVTNASTTVQTQSGVDDPYSSSELLHMSYNAQQSKQMRVRSHLLNFVEKC